MKTLYYLSGLFLLMGLFSCTMYKKSVDLLVINARIYTVDSAFTIAEAMAVHQGMVVETGRNADIQERYRSKTVLDLRGKPVYPGFIDSHCHFYGYGVKIQTMANLKPAHSFPEVIRILKEHRKSFGGSWLTGRAWDQNDWDIPEFPDNQLLNEAFPDIPVVLVRIDGHAVIVNQAAIDQVGMTPEKVVKPGEALMKEGHFTGVFLENTADLFKAAIPDPDQELILKGLDKAQNDCFAVGLTSVADAGLSLKTVQLMDSLQKSGFLKMQIYAMLEPSKENLEYFVRKGPYQTADLNVRSIKIYADGALGSRGACLLEPYTDAPHSHGILVTSEKEIKSLCEAAYTHGYQVNTHCIGDSANRNMLRIYGSFLKGKNDRRWRIEHAQVIHPDDFSMFAQYSIIPAVQSTHATSDMYWAEKRLGNQRVKSAYAYKQLLAQNQWLPNGTDFPVEEINPILTFYAAVARKDTKGFPPSGFQMENALTREEALRSVTLWAAKACFEEKGKGSLEPGKLASFVVLDQDIMTVEEKSLPETKVLMTYLKGIPVFNP